MTPGKIDHANITLKGTADILNLNVASKDGMLSSEWIPDAAERKTIAQGGTIKLTVMHSQHPPVALSVLPQRCNACGRHCAEGTSGPHCNICLPIILANYADEIIAALRICEDRSAAITAAATIKLGLIGKLLFNAAPKKTVFTPRQIALGLGELIKIVTGETPAK